MNIMYKNKHQTPETYASCHVALRIFSFPKHMGFFSPTYFTLPRIHASTRAHACTRHISFLSSPRSQIVPDLLAIFFSHVSFISELFFCLLVIISPSFQFFLKKNFRLSTSTKSHTSFAPVFHSISSRKTPITTFFLLLSFLLAKIASNGGGGLIIIQVTSSTIDTQTGKSAKKKQKKHML